MTGYYTLRETEKAVTARLGGLELDFGAMAAVSNLHRAASAVRNHFEQSVLRDVDLTWTGFVVLWVVWIWEEMETKHVAEECGISKGTLTGVAKTLESRGLLVRTVPPDDRRLSVLSLTARGRELMTELFPRFNAEEKFALTGLSDRRIQDLTRTLRHMVKHIEETGEERETEVRASISDSKLPGLAADGRQPRPAGTRRTDPRRRARKPA
ncbi:MarR family winged helix-turn-helix transcriptional regulator [Amycolatopsis sp. NPDC059021]|uniref:MarR family winged helix-turn-helix transcriptional regulator n=1 Tax=Amycolatopsis sp. NPDC059021 TaxID=3346704 RepID=UPI00366CE05B